MTEAQFDDSKTSALNPKQRLFNILLLCGGSGGVGGKVRRNDMYNSQIYNACPENI